MSELSPQAAATTGVLPETEAPPLPAAPPPSSIRYPQLDGLRGFATLMVYSFHFVVFARKAPFTGWIDRALESTALFMWGSADLFFMLSGFLITGILLDSRGKPNYFRNFYIRRFLRIFPLYYGLLFVFFLVLPHFIDFPGQFYLDRQAWFWLYVSNWATAFRGAWSPLPYLDHFWTLSIEEQFYMLWPLLIFVTPRRRVVPLAISLILGCLGLRLYLAHHGSTMVTIYTLTPTRLDSLAVGGMIAAIARAPGGFDLMVRVAKPLMIVSGGILGVAWAILGALKIEYMFCYTFGFTLMQMFFGSFMLLCLKSELGRPLYRFICWRPFTHVGELGYGFYVAHYIVVISLCVWTTLDDGRGTIFGSRLFGQWRLFLAMSALTWLGGYLSYHGYEKQFLRLKKYFPSGASR